MSSSRKNFNTGYKNVKDDFQHVVGKIFEKQYKGRDCNNSVFIKVLFCALRHVQSLSAVCRNLQNVPGDHAIAARWLENPYWQYFCGEAYFRTELPFHYTSLGKWRLRIGTEKIELVLEETIRIAGEKKFVTEKDLSRVIVDTTVQEKNITLPTNPKLPMHAIVKPAKFAKHHGIPLRQPYARKTKQTAKKLLLQEKNTPKKIYRPSGKIPNNVIRAATVRECFLAGLRFLTGAALIRFLI